MFTIYAIILYIFSLDTHYNQKDVPVDRGGSRRRPSEPQQKKGWLRIPMEKLKNAWKKMKKKRLIAVILVVVLLIVLWRSCAGQNGNRASAADNQYLSATVDRGDITSSISASGTLEPADSYTVTTLSSGEILTADFEEGDQVTKGEVLYQVDSSDASSNLEKAQLTLEQAQRSYERALESQEDQNVKSTTAGTVMDVQVEAGDEVTAGQTLAEVQNRDTVSVEVPFLSSDAQQISVGQSASVTLDSTFETLTGTVTKVSGADQVLSGNRIVRMVTVEVHNPGAITEGGAATVTVGNLACTGSGTVSYKSSATITAPAAGTVTTVYVSEGDKVSKDQALLHIDSDTVEDQVESAYRSLRDAEISLENLNDNLEDYTITSPIDGNIVEKNYKAGDTLESGKTLCTIYDLSYLSITLTIDELDISKLEVGQEVTITAEAVEGQTFKGVITNVSVKGTTANGATTYPVTVRVDDPGDLWPGMNVDCVIITEQVTNVLRIPAGAVNRTGQVLVKGADNGGDESLPEGYGYQEVTIGTSDGNYAEVLSGLEEGDEILYTPAASSSDFAGMQVMMGEPMMGGGGPAGGGPGM